MSDNVAAGQRASLLGDVSLDQETKVGVENQLNSDSGKGLGATLMDMVSGGSPGSASSEGSSVTSLPTESPAAEQGQRGGQAQPKSTASGEIPTGLDAIKAGGPQSTTKPYCEPHQ